MGNLATSSSHTYPDGGVSKIFYVPMNFFMNVKSLLVFPLYSFEMTWGLKRDRLSQTLLLGIEQVGRIRLEDVRTFIYRNDGDFSEWRW